MMLDAPYAHDATTAVGLNTEKNGNPVNPEYVWAPRETSKQG